MLQWEKSDLQAESFCFGGGGRGVCVKDIVIQVSSAVSAVE